MYTFFKIYLGLACSFIFRERQKAVADRLKKRMGARGTFDDCMERDPIVFVGCYHMTTYHLKSQISIISDESNVPLLLVSHCLWPSRAHMERWRRLKNQGASFPHSTQFRSPYKVKKEKAGIRSFLFLLHISFFYSFIIDPSHQIPHDDSIKRFHFTRCAVCVGTIGPTQTSIESHTIGHESPSTQGHGGGTCIC